MAYLAPTNPPVPSIPTNLKPANPKTLQEGSHFDLILDDGTPREAEASPEGGKTIENYIPGILRPADLPEGQQYVLDEVKSTVNKEWTWYMAGATGLDYDLFTVDDFYNVVKQDNMDFYKDLQGGFIRVSYALDANGDGIADKYQSGIDYILGEGEGDARAQEFKNLGTTSVSVTMPGSSHSHRYATETAVVLDGCEAVVPENKTHTGWEVSCDGKKLFTVAKGEDDQHGNATAKITNADGSVETLILGSHEQNLLTAVKLTIKGRSRYTVKAMFEDVPATPSPAPADPTPTPAPGGTTDPDDDDPDDPAPSPAPAPTAVPVAPPPVVPAPAGPVAPVTPADPAAELPEDETPLAAPAAPVPTATPAPAGAEELGDDPTPLAGPGRAAWALVNLILMALTVLASILLLIGFMGKKQKELRDSSGNLVTDAEGSPMYEWTKKRHGGVRVFSLVPALAAAAVFILTEDMRLPMALADRWTLLMLLIALVQLAVCFFARKSKDEMDEEDGTPGSPAPARA